MQNDQSNPLVFPMPAKIARQFEEEGKRYYGAYGGRGSAKSKSYAARMVIRCLQKPTRGFCAREKLKSIRESVHEEMAAIIRARPQLLEGIRIQPNVFVKAIILETRISFMFYTHERGEDRSVGESRINFIGLQNTQDAKSIANADILWLEEAEGVSEKSWKDLIPTIRADNSEIWLTWNPERETSATNQRFLINPPKNASIIKVNWQDNPWFPDVLEQERQEDLRLRPEMYGHVWEGEFLPKKTKAAVFQNFGDNHIDYKGFDYSSLNEGTPIYRAFDFGMTNCCIIATRDAYGAIYVLKEIVLTQSNTEELARVVNDWCVEHLPKGVTYHDTCDPAGNTKGFKVQNDVSDVEVLKRYQIYPLFGRILSNRLIESGITGMQTLLNQMVRGVPALQINGAQCPILIEAFQFGYAYKVDASGEILDTIKETHPYEDVIDCLRYIIVQFTGMDAAPPKKLKVPEPMEFLI
jgi:phage terminase large subunit